MSLIIDALRDDGQPKEEGWPYLKSLPTPISTWAPPKECGPLFRHAFVRKTTDVADLFTALDAGQPALFAARITEQFHLPPSDHIIRNRPNNRTVANHALVAVGHGAENGAPVILVRNSWGDSWADCGYAWLTKDYLAGKILGIAVPFPLIARIT